MHRRRLEPISQTEPITARSSRSNHVNALNNVIMNAPIRYGQPKTKKSNQSACGVLNTVNFLSGYNKLPKSPTKTKTGGAWNNEIQKPMETLKNVYSRRLLYQNFDGSSRNIDSCKVPPLRRMIRIAPHLLDQDVAINLKTSSYEQSCTPTVKKEYSRRRSVSPASEITRTYIRSPELPNGFVRTSDIVHRRIQTDFSRFPSFVEMI